MRDTAETAGAALGAARRMWEETSGTGKAVAVLAAMVFAETTLILVYLIGRAIGSWPAAAGILAVLYLVPVGLYMLVLWAAKSSRDETARLIRETSAAAATARCGRCGTAVPGGRPGSAHLPPWDGDQSQAGPDSWRRSG